MQYPSECTRICLSKASFVLLITSSIVGAAAAVERAVPRGLRAAAVQSVRRAAVCVGGGRLGPSCVWCPRDVLCEPLPVRPLARAAAKLQRQAHREGAERRGRPQRAVRGLLPRLA